MFVCVSDCLRVCAVVVCVVRFALGWFGMDCDVLFSLVYFGVFGLLWSAWFAWFVWVGLGWFGLV